MAIPQASSTRFPGSKRWRASIRRSNGKFFPTMPDDSTGFEDSKVVSGSHEPKYLSQDLTPEIITDFVAMSYNEDLINSAYREGIHLTIRQDCKMDPVLVKDIPHNEKICDKIIAEIRTCQFLIADVTKASANVYFEAGFAMGLNRPVIWTCKDEVF